MRPMEEIEYLNAENDNLKKKVKSLQEENLVKDMVGAELHNENKELKKNLETSIAMWEHEKNLRKDIAKYWAKAKDRIKELEEIEHKYNQLCWKHEALQDEDEKLEKRIKELEAIVNAQKEK